VIASSAIHNKTATGLDYKQQEHVLTSPLGQTTDKRDCICFHSVQSGWDQFEGNVLGAWEFLNQVNFCIPLIVLFTKHVANV